MVHLLEERDLADGGGWDALILLLEADLLERDELVGGLVHRLVHHPVGALPNLLLLLVLQHARRQRHAQKTQIKIPESESNQIARLPAPLRRPSSAPNAAAATATVAEQTGVEEGRGGWGEMEGDQEEMEKRWGKAGAAAAGKAAAAIGDASPWGLGCWSSSPRCCSLLLLPAALVALAFMCSLTAAFLAAAQPSPRGFHCLLLFFTGDDLGVFWFLLGCLRV